MFKARHQHRKTETARNSSAATGSNSSVIASSCTSSGDNGLNSAASCNANTLESSSALALSDGLATSSSSQSRTNTGDNTTSTSSSGNTSPVSEPSLQPLIPGPHGPLTPPLACKKKHSLHLMPRSAQSPSSPPKAAVSAVPTGRAGAVGCAPEATGVAPPVASPSPISSVSSVPAPSLIPLVRYPTHIELRAQYDRSGRLVRAVEEFYDHDATLPCLAYGTPPPEIGSEAFGRPPPYL